MHGSDPFTEGAPLSSNLERPLRDQRSTMLLPHIDTSRGGAFALHGGGQPESVDPAPDGTTRAQRGQISI
jgi:hypothetical protein